MKISALPSFRMTALALALLCVAALAVGRMAGPGSRLRVAERPRFVAVHRQGSPASAASLGFLNLDTGDVEPFQLSGGDALVDPACAPWRDEQGRGQVAGRWLNRSGQDESRVTTDFGLGRFTFPEGEPIDRIPSDVLPEGPPCWYPGTQAKILFAAANGTLYRFAFEGSTAPDARPNGADPRPVPIVWKVAPPGEDERSVRMADPIWPEGRGFGGRVIVSLRLQVRDGDEVRFSPPRLWSLKLDREGGAIEAAAPLAPEESVGLGDVKVRYPRTVRWADGRDRIAFLAKEHGQRDWALAAARIALDEDGAPVLEPEETRLVVDRCEFAPPAFSTEGRWLYYLPTDHRIGGMVRAPVGR